MSYTYGSHMSAESATGANLSPNREFQQHRSCSSLVFVQNCVYIWWEESQCHLAILIAIHISKITVTTFQACGILYLELAFLAVTSSPHPTGTPSWHSQSFQYAQSTVPEMPLNCTNSSPCNLGVLLSYRESLLHCRRKRMLPSISLPKPLET